MRILVLGGTRFIGRAIVETALAHDHEVTLFNRGTHRDVVPSVPRIVGDRNSDDVRKLADGEWDSIVDVSAYKPAEVRSALDVLRGRFTQYVYISTVSVYDNPPPGSDESAALLRVEESIPAGTPEAYGGLKVLCEQALRSAVADRLTVLRPTVVIGPHDYTDRFPSWVRGVARGGRVPVPRRVEQPVQLIDASDLGAFAVHALEQRIVGTFNAVGPREPMTLGSMVSMLAAAFGSEVELDPASGREFPLTLPEDGSRDGYFSVSGAAAYAAGLTLRPLGESGLDVLHAQQELIESR